MSTAIEMIVIKILAMEILAIEIIKWNMFQGHTLRH